MSNTTKRAIEASLKKLLLVKPLDKITISDIAEDCGINRMTFYYHFKDIYDLIEWSCEEDAAKALGAKKPTAHGSREQVEMYLYKVTRGLLLGVVEEEAVDMEVRCEDKEF